MSRFTETPAVIMMIDATRGDLFAVIGLRDSYVVRVKEALIGADQAIRRFVPGNVGLTLVGEPAVLRLAPNTTYVSCEQLRCTTPCSTCGAQMEAAGLRFVCTGCGNAV